MSTYLTTDSLVSQLKYGKCSYNQNIYFEKIHNQHIEVVVSVNKIVYNEYAKEALKFTVNKYENYFNITVNNTNLIYEIEFTYILIGRYIGG